MKAIKESIQQNDGMPTVLKEKLSEAQVLLTRFPIELQNRGDYLQTNVNYRLEYENLREKFFEWARNAGEKLKTTESGINFDNAQMDLEDHVVSVTRA